MKYLIIGLGSFGSSLAQKLTSLGNEVIGVDIKMEKVNAMKDQITYAVCLDATNPNALESLPIKNTDVAIVCIGEAQGANILATANLKKLKLNRIISRSLNPLHENVLQAIGITEIVHPEEESAERWAKKLMFKEIIDSFELNNNYSIIEIKVPESLIGKTIAEVGFRNTFNILILTIIQNKEKQNLLGMPHNIPYVQGIPDPETKFQKDDILVIYGSNKDIQNFIAHP
mgnify:FL=1